MILTNYYTYYSMIVLYLLIESAVILSKEGGLVLLEAFEAEPWSLALVALLLRLLSPEHLHLAADSLQATHTQKRERERGSAPQLIPKLVRWLGDINPTSDVQLAMHPKKSYCSTV